MEQHRVYTQKENENLRSKNLHATRTMKGYVAAAEMNLSQCELSTWANYSYLMSCMRHQDICRIVDSWLLLRRVSDAGELPPEKSRAWASRVMKKSLLTKLGNSSSHPDLSKLVGSDGTPIFNAKGYTKLHDLAYPGDYILLHDWFKAHGAL